jgi:hypothetical protein
MARLEPLAGTSPAEEVWRGPERRRWARPPITSDGAAVAVVSPEEFESLIARAVEPRSPRR